MNTPFRLNQTNSSMVIFGMMIIGSIFFGLGPRDRNFEAPLFENLGNYYWKVSAESRSANDFFTQGMIMSYGFNHGEAERSFKEAIRLDSTCAMAYWGLAYTLGPNYNAGMDEKNYQLVQWAVDRALYLRDNLPDVEKYLIDAIAAKYPKDTREPSPEKYQESLKIAHDKFPEQVEITTLLAESKMNEHAWDLYEGKGGNPKLWTPEIVGLLEEAMDKDDDHPLANHLYIHATEASKSPDAAYKSAEVLSTVVPGSGHLVHMPSHTYINTGDYHLGSLANEQAVIVDSTYVAQCKVKGVYPQLYYPHNYHFLSATAAMEGRAARSIEAAFTMADIIDRNYLGKPGFETVQHYLTVPYNTLVKFQQWEKIRVLNMPDEKYSYPVAIWNYAKGMAYINARDLTDLDKELAQKHLSEVIRISEMPEMKSFMIWDINSAAQVINIAVNVLEAEIARKTGDPTKAIELYKEAIALEDSLNYNEPPDWFFSVRHALGDLLLEMKEFEKAEKVYRQDLITWPKNGYALNGLYYSLKGQGLWREATTTAVEFKEAWQYADIKLGYSRMDSETRKDIPLKLGYNSPDKLIYLAGTYCGL